jgi:hypothetical protein
MIKLPCVENKCILYPLCKRKHSIKCTILSEVLRRYIVRNFKYDLRRIKDDEILMLSPESLYLWDCIEKIFPKLYEIDIVFHD